MYRLSCKALGLETCEYVAVGETWEETLAYSQMHAAEHHRGTLWPSAHAEFAQKIQESIFEE